MSVSADGLDMGTAITRLRAEKPEYIAIGNSMIFSRLGTTPEKMNQLSGHKFSFILRGGSTPGAWYLTLKHVVAASGIHPKLVFFFCRDTELTSPYANTNDLHTAYLNSLRRPQDRLTGAPRTPVVQKRFFRDAVDRVSQFLNGQDGIYNFSTRPDLVQGRITNAAMRAGYGRRVMDGDRRSLTERFGLDHLRPDVPGDMPNVNAESTDDTYQPTTSLYVSPNDSSLLPRLMELAEEHGFKLLFFRVKRRPEAQGGTVTIEPPEMRGYVQRLQLWLEKRDALFYDETYDPAIRLEAYNDGDHVGEEHRDWYRRYFWQRMASVFP